MDFNREKRKNPGNNFENNFLKLMVNSVKLKKKNRHIICNKFWRLSKITG